MEFPPILFENEDVLVINKPAGLVVHGDGKAEFETLADVILRDRPELSDVGEPMELHGKKVLRPGIVHRLDKETSGCLLIAKNQRSFLFLKDQFQNHTIQKTYHACLHGAVKENEGIINAPIGRAVSDIRKWATGRGARGELREAQTDFKILSRIGVEEGKGSTESGTYSYIEAFPKTGRTHQLRVHFKHINHPILHDTLYAPQKDSSLGFGRLALHARSISFVSLNGDSCTVLAPFPVDFLEARKQFGFEK